MVSNAVFYFMSTLVSVICPIYNEEKFIGRCIESMIHGGYPVELIELLCIDGRSKDRTREIITEYSKRYPQIKLIDNPHKTVPFALNIGIKEAKGDVIIRIDAHCEYPLNYISKLVKKLDELKADNVGAMLNTIPANDSSICKAIAFACSHWFGVGMSRFRIGISEECEVDTVPFGCFRREIFERIGMFDEELIRNQDDEFNGRLIKHGGKIFILPSLVINYVARDSIKKMCKMYYQYGLFKPLVNKKLKTPATIRQFFPVFFLLGIIIGAGLSCFFTLIMKLYLGILFLYFGIGILVGIQGIKKYKTSLLIFLMPVTFFLLHISYGFGYLKGIGKILFKKKFFVEINR